MIKLTHIPSETTSAPALFLVPGGPGLSSGTLRSMDLLARSFHLYYVDLPGTNGVPFDRERSLTLLAGELADEVRKVGKRAFVLGHSFGGFLAAEAALRSGGMAAGLVCLATPFSKESQDAAVKNYMDARGPELKKAEERLERRPFDASFKDWLSKYGRLYFSEGKAAEGEKMLAGDSSSYLLFQSLRQEARRLGTLLARLAEWRGSKLFVAGRNDGLLPVEQLESDAIAAGFSFAAVSDACHFVGFDQPEAVAGLIEKYCATGGRTL